MKYFLAIQFALVVSIQLDESVLKGGRSGTDVVLLSIAYIHQVAIFQDDNNLLRRIAFVETEDGLNTDAFNQGNSGGIWAVGEDAFVSTQLQVNKNVNTTLLQTYEKIRLFLGIEWDTLQWSELNKPLYSALAARLVLYIAPEDIPSSDAEQALFWKDHYNGDGSVKDFVRAGNKLKGKYSCAVYNTLALLIVTHAASFSTAFPASVLHYAL